MLIFWDIDRVNIENIFIISVLAIHQGSIGSTLMPTDLIDLIYIHSN